MFVGMTSRGWGSTGKALYGLQRLVWTGKTPFEIATMKARNDGFELTFTKPLDRERATNLENYGITTFNYKYHYKYGSPIVGQQKAKVTEVLLGDDGKTVSLKVDGMRLGYIHQLKLGPLTSTGGERLLHDTGYYTLNEVPGGSLKSKALENKGAGNAIVQEKWRSEMPLTWTNGPDHEVVIGTKPGLKYDRGAMELQAGAKIKLTFNNNDDMLHNLVFTQKGAGTVDKVAEMALEMGLDGADYNYVPDTDDVLAHTGILEPGTSQQIYFQVPNDPGIYWIVCTFPGHANSMRIKVTVTANS